MPHAHVTIDMDNCAVDEKCRAGYEVEYMNLTFLRYAVEVEKTGSISLAARNLYLGQPNVSKAIKELELSLGITIFKRTPRGVVPTQKGEEFLHYARTILTQIDELETMFKDETADKVSFRIAVPRAGYITAAFADFAGRMDVQKGVNMAYNETGSVDVIERVAQQEYSLGIIRYDTEYENHFQTMLGDKGLVSKPIWEMNCLLLLSREHPLAKEPVIDSRQLEDCVELVYGDKSVPYLSTADARRSASIEEQKRHISIYEHSSLYELLNSVKGAYMWTSPVPADVLERNGCVQRRCMGNVPNFKDVLVYQRDYRLKEIDRQFIASLNHIKDELAWIEYR